MHFGLIFALSFWQEVKFDIWIGQAPNVHGRQILPLEDVDVQNSRREVVFNLQC